MRLLLARHGLTDKTGPVLAGRMPGVHLNDAGRAQADRLAERLTDVPICAAYTSPLERCRETIAPAARGHGLRAKVDKRLIEVGYGDWTGQPLPKLAKDPLWKTVQHRPSMARFPGRDGEALQDASARIVAALDDLRGRHTGEDDNVLVCSHADMIKLALAHYCGMHIDQYQRIVVAPTSLSVLRFGSFGVQVEHMNDLGSLDDLLPAAEQSRRGGRAARQNRSKAAKEWGHA